MRKIAGFSLIELMVVTVISGVLMAGGIAAYRSIGGKQQVKQAGITFQTNLRLFQGKALAGEKPDICAAANKLLYYEVKWISATSYSVKPICSGKATTAVSYDLDEGISFKPGWTDEKKFFNQESHIEGVQAIQLVKTGTESPYYEVTIESSGVISGAMY